MERNRAGGDLVSEFRNQGADLKSLIGSTKALFSQLKAKASTSRHEIVIQKVEKQLEGYEIRWSKLSPIYERVVQDPFYNTPKYHPPSIITLATRPALPSAA